MRRCRWRLMPSMSQGGELHSRQAKYIRPNVFSEVWGRINIIWLLCLRWLQYPKSWTARLRNVCGPRKLLPSEMLRRVGSTTWRHIPVDDNFHTYICCPNWNFEYAVTFLFIYVSYIDSYVSDLVRLCHVYACTSVLARLSSLWPLFCRRTTGERPITLWNSVLAMHVCGRKFYVWFKSLLWVIFNCISQLCFFIWFVLRL
jgi:hypothetical protein